LNGNHPLLKKILLADAEQQAKLAKQAYDLALLAQGMLKGADLTAFVNRSVETL
jgi:molecular chaperone HtpG